MNQFRGSITLACCQIKTNRIHDLFIQIQLRATMINHLNFLSCQINYFIMAFALILIIISYLQDNMKFFSGKLLPSAQMAGGQIIDESFFYRLTTSWQGVEKSLDIINNETTNKLQLVNSGNYSGQFWKFMSVPGYPGWYRLSNMFTNDKVLDVINDQQENNQLWMTDSGPYSGQFWKITKQNGWHRFSSMWQSKKSIDVMNDGDQNNHPWLDKTGNFSGQLWKLTKIQKI